MKSEHYQHNSVYTVQKLNTNMNQIIHREIKESVHKECMMYWYIQLHCKKHAINVFRKIEGSFYPYIQGQKW